MFGSQITPHLRSGSAALAISAALLLSRQLSATTAFDFDASNPLGSALISGDRANVVTTATVARTGANSIAFQDNTVERAESSVFDLPVALTAGTISLWFYDTYPTTTTATGKWGLSVILEDKNNAADFGALEIADLNVGGRRYYASEGSTDRLAAGKWDTAALPVRSIGWHQVVFTVGATQSTISVDGTAATVAAAPGGNKTLRLRLAGFSPSLAGTSNYVTDLVGDTHPAERNRVYVDDITFSATSPAVASASEGFEAPGGTPTYDNAANGLLPKNDNPYEQGFVNEFWINEDLAYVHSGTQSASFDPGSKRFRSLAFDLSGASPNTTATVWFYDSLGQDAGQNKFGGSILVEDGTNPQNWIAAEVWNFAFPYGAPAGQFRYFGSGSASAGGRYLDTKYYGFRSIGWHKVEIFLEATRSSIVLDGLENQRPAVIKYGPGLDKSPKLRLLFDSAAVGSTAGLNYRTVDELDAIYDNSATINTPYLYFDNITLPVSGPAGISEWSVY